MAGITFTEGSGLQDSIFGKSQAPIRMFLEKRGEAFEQKSVLPYIFEMETSKHWAEKFTTMTAMDGFQPVGENGEYPEDMMQEAKNAPFIRSFSASVISWKRWACPSTVVFNPL